MLSNQETEEPKTSTGEMQPEAKHRDLWIQSPLA